MKESELAAAAERLAGGEVPPGALVMKRSRVRIAARLGDTFLKVSLKYSRSLQRESRGLRRAAELGIPVPSLIAGGERWVATLFQEGARPAQREDLEALLPIVERMHDAGMLHGDLHLGNWLVGEAGPVLLDLQKTRFWPLLTGGQRNRELAFLAHSLGDPLPDSLAHLSKETRRRAHAHWRSRTKRCLVDSSSFAAFEFDGERGFRRRDSDEGAILAALHRDTPGTVIKRGSGGNLFRIGEFIVKEHRNARRARRSWVAGHGLEVRGIATGRALAWVGRWLVMEDAGDTLYDWVLNDFEKAGAGAHQEMVECLARLLGTLHRRGVYHADLKSNNILWVPGREPRLVDYGRVHFERRSSFARRVKNLAQLNAALPDPVPAVLRERCFRAYLEQSEFDGDAEKLRREVIRESLARGDFWTGCQGLAQVL